MTEFKPSASPTANSAAPNAPSATGSVKTGGNIVLLPKAPEPPAGERALAWVKRHPVLTIAGGLAIGAAASALLPRRAAKPLLRRAVGLAEAAGTAAAIFGRNAADSAQSAGHSASRSAGVLASRAERFGEYAADRAEKLGLAALESAGVLGSVAATKSKSLGRAASRKSTRLIGYPSRSRSLAGRVLALAGR